MPLGDLINQARIRKRLGLRALARELGIAPSYLADIENDRRIPSEPVLRRISALLELDFDFLMHQAGRLGEGVEDYLRQQEFAGQFFRKVAETNLGQAGLRELQEKLDELATREDEE